MEKAHLSPGYYVQRSLKEENRPEDQNENENKGEEEEKDVNA